MGINQDGKNTKHHLFTDLKSVKQNKNINFHFETVSNDTYLKKYDISSPIKSDTDLNSKIELTGSSNNFDYVTSLEINENDSYILSHNWKGNVRELRNLIERIAILQPETKEKISNIIKESLKNNNFTDQISENDLSVPLKEAREKFEKEYLTIQLKKFNGNISKTANFVGMERSALHRKLKGLGIKEFN